MRRGYAGRFMEHMNRVLKQDSAGRVWTPRAQREAALDEFERSGLPATKFAAHIGVKYQTFAGWVRKRGRQHDKGKVATQQTPAITRWVEAAVESSIPGGSSPALVVELPGGARLEIVAAAQVALAAHLLRALESGGGIC